ncbi:MAG: S-layer homology domain-containing protein [Acidobacteriota bacterium]
MKRRIILFLGAIMIMIGIIATSLGAAPYTRSIKPQPDPQWAKQAIAEMLQKGLMVNYSGGFGSYRSITRGEMAFALTKLFKLDTGDIRFIKAPQATDYYGDVANNSQYADAITMCAINNIFSTTGRQFRPNDSLTRMEAAVAIQNSFQAKKIQVFTTMQYPIYVDMAKIGDQLSSAMCFVSNSGMMQGYKNYFRPFSPLTRAEAACLLFRAGKTIEQCSPRK